MSATVERARTVETVRPALLDRVLAFVPLLTIFFWLCLVYAFEAWAHRTPWLFTDELEWTQLARSIATTGHAARRGVPYSWKSVYSFLTAPAWKLHDTQSAYDTVKYIGVVAMTAVVFPAYGLARIAVSRRAALFVAAAAAVVPALVYSSFIVTEPIAYPYATLCLFLIAKALVTRRVRWIVAAAIASLLATYVRGQLGILVAAYVVAALAFVASGDRARAYRARWSRWDWAGALLLLVGVVLFLSAYIGHHSYSWLIATGFYKHRMFHYGLDAAGALMIGLGVLPFVGGLAALVPARGEPRTLELRAFRCVLGSGILVFALYTAVKASYLSTVFEGRIEERNLFYLAPLLFVGTAVLLERRVVNPFALGVAGAFALLLVFYAPYRMDLQFYSDAPGLAILQQGNRYLGWTPTSARIVLLFLLAVSLAVLGAALVRRVAARPWAVVTAAVAVGVVAWNFTGELAASEGANGSADVFASTMHRPYEWLDRATHGKDAVYLGQHVTDQNGVYLLEFWNRSLRDVWSLDGTAPGPGPTLTPDLADTAGDLIPDPNVPYAVADSGIAIAGKLVTRHARLSGGGRQYWRLYRIEKPFRLRANVTGRDPDGWVTARPGGDDAIGDYNQYSTPGGRAGTVVVNVSRRESGLDAPARVTVYVGELIVGNDHQPAMGRVTAVRKRSINAHQHFRMLIPAPAQRFRVEVHITPPFQPCTLDPVTSHDCRELGAVVRYGVIPRGSRKAEMT